MSEYGSWIHPCRSWCWRSCLLNDSICRLPGAEPRVTSVPLTNYASFVWKFSVFITGTCRNSDLILQTQTGLETRHIPLPARCLQKRLTEFIICFRLAHVWYNKNIKVWKNSFNKSSPRY